MSKKIIAVTGATGAQGGGLARAILNDPSGEFALRAVTRNPDVIVFLAEVIQQQFRYGLLVFCDQHIGLHGVGSRVSARPFEGSNLILFRPF